jgi:ADP-ribosyl-[dinitrogen reductase] hydrolase
MEMDSFPKVTEMIPCRHFHTPAGYWTDDGAMALCIMESAVRCQKYDLEDIADNFIRWYDDGFCSSLDYSFDVGSATVMGIHGLKRGELCNGFEDSQGNGSIMRFAPSLLLDNGDNRIIHEVSDLTHDSCKVRETIDLMAEICRIHLSGVKTTFQSEYSMREEVNNSGWAVSTLQAALWAFQSTENFEDALIEAVNLGGDDSGTVHLHDSDSGSSRADVKKVKGASEEILTDPVSGKKADETGILYVRSINLDGGKADLSLTADIAALRAAAKADGAAADVHFDCVIAVYTADAFEEREEAAENNDTGAVRRIDENAVCSCSFSLSYDIPAEETADVPADTGSDAQTGAGSGSGQDSGDKGSGSDTGKNSNEAGNTNDADAVENDPDQDTSANTEESGDDNANENSGSEEAGTAKTAEEDTGSESSQAVSEEGETESGDESSTPEVKTGESSESGSSQEEDDSLQTEQSSAGKTDGADQVQTQSADEVPAEGE